MMDSIILALPFIGCCLPFLGRMLGKSLCKSYNERYYDGAVVLLPSCFQSVAVVAFVAHLIFRGADELSTELVLSILCVVVSHALGLWMCIKHAVDQGAERKYIACASIAQMLLPLSNTILLMMAIGTIASLPTSIRALVVGKYLALLFVADMIRL